jgi:hypothetical protein
LAESEVEIRWFVPENIEPGLFRISHFGANKPIFSDTPKYYSGTTNSFEVNI